MTTDLIQLEIRERSDGMWDVLLYDTSQGCTGPCTDHQHHPDCGYTHCTTEEGEAGAREAVSEHYAEWEYNLTVRRLEGGADKVIKLSSEPGTPLRHYPTLILSSDREADAFVDPRSLGGEAYPDHSVADPDDPGSPA